MLSLVSMAAMSIGAAAVACVWAFSVRGTSAGSLAMPRAFRSYLLASLALTAACALSLIAAMLWPLSFHGEPVEVRFLADMAKAWYLFWPVLLAWALLSVGAEGRDKVLRAWILAFGALSMIGIAQHFTGWPRAQPIPGNDSRFHAVLFLGHHLSVASVFIFPFFACLDFVAHRGSALKLPRAALALFAICGVATLFLTYSRILWVALPPGLMLWALLSLPGRRAKLLAAGGVLVATLILSQVPEVRSRASASMGIGERTALWSANLEFFRERPLTGAGWHKNLPLAGAYFHERFPGQDLFVGHAHDNFLEMLGSTGLAGVLAWLGWCLLVVALAWRARGAVAGPGEPVFARGLICAWLVFHLNGLTQVNFWESKVLHQMMWAVAWTLVWAARRETPA